VKKTIILFLLLILFCGFFYKTNNVTVDKSKFFIQDLNYRDFSLKRLSDVDYEELQLVDCTDEIYIEGRRHCASSEFYYYSILDTTNYYSYVYYLSKEYQSAFILVNYDKKMKYIDDVSISSYFGSDYDIGCLEGVFLNDSTIIRVDIAGEYGGWNYKNDTIINLSKYEIVLQKDGHILIDTVIYNLVPW